MAGSGNVVGPQTTVALCSAAPSASSDPWLIRDPWQQTLQKIPVASAPNMVNQLQEMEERLERSLLDKLPLEKMEVDGTDQRIQVLEQQMQTLTARHQHLEGTVTENHRQHTAQVQGLQVQMMSQMEANRTQMASMFDDQMSKLEAILAKKGRYE